MIFKKKSNTLDLYNKQPREAKSSVIESLDYEFAISIYTNKDFRFQFIVKNIINGILALEMVSKQNK